MRFAFTERTFSHEFVHFVEKWSPEQYNILREAVFAEMERNGRNTEELVELAMQEQGLSFEQASREVVAEALTDILPDSQFVQTLASKHKTLFDRLKERLERFVANLKDHWGKLAGNSSREAVALKRQVGDALEYAEEIVQLFDQAAGEAVESYQATVSEKETIQEERATTATSEESSVVRSGSIVDQMRDALPEIMDMEAVATIDASNATAYEGVHKLDEKAGLAEFRKQGGSAYREGFGRVLLSRKGVVDTVFHGNGPAKQASFPAIKAVIERGIEIGSDFEHKGRGFDTVTFAAPIDFFGNKKLLGVVVKVYRNGRGDSVFYIHEICDSEGNYVRMDEIKEISNTGELDSSSSAGVADSEVSLSDIVPDTGRNVKSKNAGRGTEARKPGKVHYEGDLSDLTELQRVSMRALEKVAEALDIQIHLFESEADEDGIRHDPNGWYDTNTGDIYLDLNAGLDGKGTMMFTAAHELTHFIKQWSPEKFGKLADFLVEKYGEKGVSVQELVERQQAKAQRGGRELSYEDAFEEMVADSMESMLADGDVVQRLAELKAADKTLWEKLKQKLTELVQKLKAAYKGLKPDSAEGKYVAEMVDAAERLKELFTEGLTDAGRNHRNAPAEQDVVDDSDILFSFAGEGAKHADAVALAKAQKMHGNGIAMRDIFQETGWFRGADGKWRFEIDDSGMKYHKMGDAQFGKDHPEYRRYRELELKFIECTITDAEIAEMAELRSTWANEAPRLRQMVVRGNAKLYQVLAHDALFEQYPQLRDTKVRFGETDDAGGWWDKERNEIVLSDRYRHADPAFLELTLLHEIQHAIQDIEGFAGGSNPEYWEDVQNTDWAIRENDAAIAKAEQEAQEALKGIPPEIARDFWYAANMRETDPEGAEELENKLFEGEYSDAYSDYSWAIWTLQDLMEQDNPKRTAKDLYRSTAGEIEARDAANRRHLDPEARKKRLPDTGDERTVFVEGAGLALDLIGKRPDGIEVYETSEETRNLTWKERKNKFLRLMRDQYRGRTAKFIRNGHTYYAAFEYRDVSKNIYGDNKSDPKAKDAKVNVGADGGIFELVENAEYFLSESERGKTQRMHRGVKYWDYFIKTVQIDGEIYDLLAHIRKKDSGSFVYDIEMYQNKRIEPSSPEDSHESGRNRVPNGSIDILPENGLSVNTKFSDRDPAAQKLNRALQKQNEAQAQEIEHLRELVKLQGQVTNGTKFTHTSVRTLARQLMKDAGAKGNYLELSEKLNRIYESIAAQDDPLGLSWSEVEGKIDEAARWLVEHIEVKPDRGEYANDILRDLRGRRISLNQGQRAEVESRYGSYDTFRRSMFGSFTLSKDGTPLDMVWQELASQYPGTFDADIGDADMALELADIVARLRETDVAAMEFEMQRDGLLEDLRQKVYDGYWKVSTLYTVADKWQEKVNSLKRQHQTAMEKLDKARQERDAANADRVESVRKVRQQKNEAVKEVRKQYQEAKKKSVESRKKTEMRHRIQRVVKELNALLLKPDKKRHVPEGLRKVVAEALDAVNMDHLDAAGRIEAINDELAELHTKRVLARKAGETKEAVLLLGKIRQLEQSKARLEDLGGRVDEKLKALHAAYEEIKESADPEIANAYDEGLSSYILMKAAMVSDTPLKNMNMEQLGHVYDLYTMMLHTIRDSNKAFNDGNAKDVREMADNARREITSNGTRNKLGIKLVEQLRKFGINNLKPVYFFQYLNSKTMRKLWQGLLNGQNQYGRNMAEARAFKLEQQKKFGYYKWDMTKTWSFTAASGKRFKLNLEQIMALYAHSKRDQSREHIRKGGIVIDPETEIQEVVEVGTGAFKVKVKVKGKSQDATAYNIDDATLDEIIGKLTKKQRAYVDAMQDYLSTVMGNKGNEVSMKLYGIKLFKEQNYFPLRSAQEYSARAKEQAEQTARLKNAGFTKATTPHASNPIMLTEFDNVWSDHVQEMSQYHAMTLPIEDLYRVYNYNWRGDGTKDTQSVAAAMKNAFGEQATGYVDQLLKDMNGRKFLDSAGELQSKLVSKFKKGAVFMSASVLFQQSSSVARALSEIDVKYMAPWAYVESLTVIPRQLLGKVSKATMDSHDKLWAELKKYAPVAVIKEMGSFDMSMGKTGRDYLNAKEYSGFKDKFRGLIQDSSYRDEVLSRAPALADELAWCDIWRAVKREQHAKHPKLKLGSKEFLELCGERFTEVIDKTQVYDSVLSRSANMRSSSELMKMATSFMAEPTVTVNMLANAVMEAKLGHRGKAGRIIGSVVAANIINAALAALVYAGRDDDEDKEYWEKYLGHLSGEFVDSMNPLTYVPIAQDILSICAGWDVERADMAVVSDLVNAWNKLSSENATGWQKARDMLGATSQIFGLPLKNLLRDGEALWRIVNDAFDEQDSTATGIGYAIRAELPEWIGGGAVSNGDQLYEAILNGDKAHEERVRARFKDKDGNIDEGEARNALRKAIRENDSRIHEAAVYLNEGESLGYYALIEEIVGEGHFSKSDVVYAIESEAKAIFEKQNGYPLSELEDVFVGGEISAEDAGGFLVSHGGYARTEAQSKVLQWQCEIDTGIPFNGIKEAYLEGEITEAEAEQMYFKYGGYDREKAEAAVEKWRAEKDTGTAYDDIADAVLDGEITEKQAADMYQTYGGYEAAEAQEKAHRLAFIRDNPGCPDISSAAVADYETYCKGAGISTQTFYDAWKRFNDTKSIKDENDKTTTSKRDQVMAQIDAMNLTKAQKDALYFAFGYAESKLWDTPWH